MFMISKNLICSIGVFALGFGFEDSSNEKETSDSDRINEYHLHLNEFNRNSIQHPVKYGTMDATSHDLTNVEIKINA